MSFMRAARSTLSHYMEMGKIRNTDSTIRLKTWLEECGYCVFDVSQKRQRSNSDIVAVLPNDPTSSVWIYQRKSDDKFVVRAFVNHCAYNNLYETLCRSSSEMDMSDISLVQGGTLSLREAENAWLSWLSEASMQKARALELV
ncbi:hypothetical protein H6788_02310 [Candidatus Nomurabacteria bacterium]|nr:hypothetical protein [Candidatus Nomurabacteria bacterium]